jgi:hypothetical protein
MVKFRDKVSKDVIWGSEKDGESMKMAMRAQNSGVNATAAFQKEQTDAILIGFHSGLTRSH